MADIVDLEIDRRCWGAGTTSGKLVPIVCAQGGEL